MKKNIFILIAMCVNMGLIACGSDNGGGGSDTGITVNNSDALTQTLTGNETRAVALEFNTKGAWNATISDTKAIPAWISIDPLSGDKAGDYTMNFTLELNDDTVDRTAYIVITSGSSKATVAITQQCMNNQGGGVKKEKKITKITIAEKEVGTPPGVEITFKYDSQNRINEYRIGGAEFETYSIFSEFTYDADEIFVKVTTQDDGHSSEEFGEATITLNSSSYVSSIDGWFIDDEGFREIVNLSYEYDSSGRIAKTFYIDEDRETDTTLYEWENNLLVGVTFNEDERANIGYGNIRNDHNLDLNYILAFLEIETLEFVGVSDFNIGLFDAFGKRTEYLATSFDEKIGQYSYSGTYEYKLDTDGYIIGAICHYNNDNGDGEDEIYTIYYE